MKKNHPFLSIVLVTQNNEKYIKKAITSCTQTKEIDTEIIIINNNSTDRTKEIIKNFKKNMSHIQLINKKENVGLGEGRNIGIENARGDYIVFLDGDDWFEPNAINEIIETLIERKPEILMFNHQRVWPNQIKQVNIPNKYVELTEKDEDLTAPQKRKKSIKNLHVAWNKAYKASLIKRIKVKFPEGYYEDVYFSIISFIEAKTVYYTGKVFINYRQRDGSITKTSSSKHFDIFKQYEKTFERISITKKTTSCYLPEIIEYSTSQIYGIINTQIRIPPQLEDMYLKEAEKHITKWKKLIS